MLQLERNDLLLGRRSTSLRRRTIAAAARAAARAAAVAAALACFA